MRLDGKVAIVTGGAHGMGEAEARLFAKEGAKVVVADILGDRAEAVAASIRASNGAAIAAAIDVTSEPAWVALIAKTVETYGRLDILNSSSGGKAIHSWKPRVRPALSSPPPCHMPRPACIHSTPPADSVPLTLSGSI